MNKVKKHIELGLSQEELLTAIKSAGDERVINKFDDKLQNCELSHPAIELVNTEDLETVLKISNGINNKYLVSRFPNIFNKSIVVIASLFAILLSVVVFSNYNNPNTELTLVEVKEIKTINNPDLLVERDQELSLLQSEKNSNKPTKELVLESIPEKKDETAYLIESDSIINDPINIDDLTKVKPVDDFVKSKLEEPVIRADDNVKPQRIVREVLVTGMIDPKYKGDNYKISNLVDFKGGDAQLQKEIYRRLKLQIKDDDIPSASSTIVFNFKVTSRGKVKKVSVQSRTTPELENIIIKTMEGIDSWRKGSKRASKNYSVFVTFK